MFCEPQLLSALSPVTFLFPRLQLDEQLARDYNVMVLIENKSDMPFFRLEIVV